MHEALGQDVLESVPEPERTRLAEFVRANPLREVESDGRCLRYLAAGRGELPILLLTAAYGSPYVVYDSALRLGRDHRVVVADVGEASSLDELAADVDRVLDMEGLDRVVAFGQSLGGILAQAYLMGRPVRVEAMVLAQTVAPRRENNRRAALWVVHALPGFAIRALVAHKLRRVAVPGLPAAQAARLAASRALLLDAVRATLTRRRITHTVRLVFEFNQHPEYGAAGRGAWAGRVLVITSEDDPGFGDTERIRAALPSTEVHALPSGAGHLAPLAHGGEFWARIEQFLLSLRS